MMTFLTAVWGALTSKLAGPIATMLAIFLALGLLVQHVELRGARSTATTLQDSITAPVTGWSAQLAICTSNAASLDGALKDQSAKVADQAAAQTAKLTKARHLAAQAEAGRKRSEALVAQLSSYQTPVGAKTCDDLMAADAVVQKALQ